VNFQIGLEKLTEFLGGKVKDCSDRGALKSTSVYLLLMLRITFRNLPKLREFDLSPCDILLKSNLQSKVMGE
jgi:hypothetical protein